MHFFRRYLLFFLLTLTACTAPLHAPPEFINAIYKKKQDPANFLLCGNLKVKYSGYGWIGKIQIIRTPVALRVDTFTSLDWPLLTAVVKKGTVEIVSYNEGEVYIGKNLPETLTTWLPVGLNLDEWAIMLGKQIWLIDYKRYTFKEKKHAFVLSFVDRKNHFKEEIRLRRHDLKVEKIRLKNWMGDTLWTACFTYNTQGQVLSAQIKDISGKQIEVSYETLEFNPTINPKLFDLNQLLERIKGS
ncbi:MAG: hypothetical protein J7M03_00320 [Candidatus Desulfofervidaceae bacterium]|nr:hypothetical protein [Candidatus Desulfofervidaceae bacterium]MDL1971302.1 hypothetical protein [Candidatus Desulfofervidaceae bacterium]